MVLHASHPWATPLTLIVACLVFRLQAIAMVSPTLHGVICHSRTTQDSVLRFELGSPRQCCIKFRWTTDDGWVFSVENCGANASVQVGPALAVHRPSCSRRVHLSHQISLLPQFPESVSDQLRSACLNSQWNLTAIARHHNFPILPRITASAEAEPNRGLQLSITGASAARP